MLSDALWCPGLPLAEAPILPVGLSPKPSARHWGCSRKQEAHSHGLPGDTRPSDPMPTSSDFGGGGGVAPVTWYTSSTPARSQLTTTSSPTGPRPVLNRYPSQARGAPPMLLSKRSPSARGRCPREPQGAPGLREVGPGTSSWGGLQGQAGATPRASVEGLPWLPHPAQWHARGSLW